MIGVVSSSLLGVKMDKERSCVRDLLEIIREIIVGSLEASKNKNCLVWWSRISVFLLKKF